VARKNAIADPPLDSIEAQNAGVSADGKSQIPNELEHLDYPDFPL
jgi:hypothetical protein